MAVTTKRTITVMQPVRDEPEPQAFLSPRPAELAGLTVAFIDEGGPNADVLLAALERELVARAGIGGIVRAKTHGNRVELVDPETGDVTKVVETTGSTLDEVPKWAHAAVVGVGY